MIRALLLMLPTLALADVTLESRNGMTPLHSEGRPIIRYLSENRLTYAANDFELSAAANFYGTQIWSKRVRDEDGWLKVDKVRFLYGAEIAYKINDNFKPYIRHTIPHDRHDKSIPDGWADTSYRLDFGFIYVNQW